MDFDRMYSYSVCLEEYFIPPKNILLSCLQLINFFYYEMSKRHYLRHYI